MQNITIITLMISFYDDSDFVIKDATFQSLLNGIQELINIQTIYYKQ